MENGMFPLSTRQFPAAHEEQYVVVGKYQTILQIDTYTVHKLPHAIGAIHYLINS
jgi:hypothetical protein